MVLLQTKRLTKFFGGLAAIDNLDLEVYDSEILGIIGPNGAGKSTLFNMLSGFFLPTHGSIIFNGQDITGLRGDQIASKGISRTFQESTLFMESTILENVFTAFHMHYKQPGWKAFLHTLSAINEEKRMKKNAMAMLEFMDLIAFKDELAQNLPHGYQRTLGICIALASNPRLLLLDEPLTGMNPAEKARMSDKIKEIRERDITIMLVEHDMHSVMNICDRIAVLNYGRKIAVGRPEEIRQNKDVIVAYLGKERQ